MAEHSIQAALLLFKKASKGDTHAFASIVTLYKPYLQSCIEKYIPIDQDIFEDVLQETWISIWLQCKSIKDKKNPLPWILRIARNTAVSAIRKQKRNLSVDEIPEHWMKSSSLANNPFEGRAGQLFLLKALEGLSARQRELIVLKFANGYSNKEIARICGLSPNTVRNQLSIAKKNMRIQISRFLCWLLFIVNDVYADYRAELLEI
jgi:RNA polymerase sigma factor (sigma-70 family)